MHKTLVVQNSRKAQERVKQLAPQQLNVEETLPLLLQGAMRCPVAQGAARIVEASTDPNALSRMEATWHPWY